MRYSRFQIPERLKSTVAGSICTLLMAGLIVVAWNVFRPARTGAPEENVTKQIKKKGLVESLGAAVPPAPDNAQPSAQSDAKQEIKVPGDYDGDGEIDDAVWHARDGNWVIRQSSNKQTRYILWGMRDDVPVPDDYDDDGKLDLAVWRPSENAWLIMRSSNGEPMRRQGQSG